MKQSMLWENFFPEFPSLLQSPLFSGKMEHSKERKLYSWKHSKPWNSSSVEKNHPQEF